jgi:hypothetical protein
MSTSPHSVSINDAISIILNMPFQPGNTTLPEMIGFFREEADANRDRALTEEDRNRFAAQATMHKYREELARSLIDALENEVKKVYAGQKSVVELDTSAAPGEEKLVTASVLAWAEDIGFGISNWSPPRFWRRKSARTYSTEYLDILDDLIATWFEEDGEKYSPNYTPKKDALRLWATTKYGVISEKVLDAMMTMVIHPQIPKK